MALEPILEVAVPAPLMGTFDYLPPRSGPALLAGQRVRVPFGRGVRVGLVVALKERSALPAAKLKRALAVLDEAALLPLEVQRLLRFAAHYYQHPPGEVVAAALPKALRAGRALPKGEAPLARPGAEAAPEPDQPPALTADQAVAVERISAAPGFACFLLDGVTGSGKTEVYLRCIEQALAAGRQSLLLVPEIGLTPQLQERVARRFRVPVAALHSGLPDGERLRAWCGARDGSCGIVIGTRSAIFTPLARPGLLIVDEEHDASYKQQDGFRYSARDLAVWRARELDVPLVLGSATPSLESLENARSSRYARLVLRDRAGVARPPAVQLVDLRAHPVVDGLAAPLAAAIRRHLDAGGQALVYLNRRGYAPTLLCSGCGQVIECDRCDARMVLHQAARRVTCHHCGSERPAPSHCAGCGTTLVPVGLGTERLEQALSAAFPGEAIERIDRDTTRRRGEMERKLGRVRRAEARLLMGTQMLTKGHDFPGVTLVGIVDADQGLFGTDFRSAERLAQCLVQVAGRAGRADRPGEVYLQTLFPDHPLLKVLLGEGYGAFAELALAERRRSHWPPFSSLALLRAEAHRRPAVDAFLTAAADLARQQAPAGVTVLGPAPAPMERRSGRYRGQLLIQSAKRSTLQRFLPGWREALSALPSQKQVRISLDVDPADLL